MKEIPNTTYDMRKAEPVEPIVYILDKYDLTTNTTEISQAKALWQQGLSIYDIADKLRPTQRGTTEIFLLLLHMVEENMIKPREGRIWGDINVS